ncbi:endonuclease-reverse transcriptase [Lasius niger]|uniref:Endonuclease-reverse transcriptase n=1 Tax=Lasius niger TaxID=67767 RepID=A0A0J7JZM7_LASNI|nr:endonuclease-reverse transcriptase [Lasius niger]
MGTLGIPPHLIYLIRNLYWSNEARVRVYDQLTGTFKVGKGVRLHHITNSVQHLWRIGHGRMERRNLYKWEKNQQSEIRRRHDVAGGI